MEKLVGESGHLTEGCRRTLVILHVSWIKGTDFQDSAVSERGQSVSVLLSPTKKKALAMDGPRLTQPSSATISARQREFTASCAVHYRGKRSDQQNKGFNSRRTARELLASIPLSSAPKKKSRVFAQFPRTALKPCSSIQGSGDLPNKLLAPQRRGELPSPGCKLLLGQALGWHLGTARDSPALATGSVRGQAGRLIKPAPFGFVLP